MATPKMVLESDSSRRISKRSGSTGGMGGGLNRPSDRSLPQPLPRGRVPRARFQISFEGFRLLPIRESDIGHQFPRHVFGSVRGFSGIVIRKPLLGLGGQTNVTLPQRGLAFQEIDIPHTAALLRQGFGGHPASRSGSVQSCEAPRREAGWWGRKDSNLRSHEAAHLQSAPFATRDTPPFQWRAIRFPFSGDGTGHGDVKTAERPQKGSRPGAFMGERDLQSQPRPAPKSTRNQPKLPIRGTRDTSGPSAIEIESHHFGAAANRSTSAAR